MKTFEYAFEHPEHEPISAPVALALQNLLAMDATDETKAELLKDIKTGSRLELEYETQDNVDTPFRGNGLLHVDSHGFPHSTSFFATSTTTTTAKGHIVLKEPIERLIIDVWGKPFDFSSSKKLTLYTGLLALHESFGLEWLAVLQAGDSEVAEQIAQCITINEIAFEQVPAYSVATGYVEGTLHKSSPRKTDDPRARVFGSSRHYR